MQKFLAAILAFVTLLAAQPAQAELYEFREAVKFFNPVTNASTLTQTGNTTIGGTLGVTGATTLSSTLAVTGAVSLTVPLTAANIQSGSAKRQVYIAHVSPETGVCADGTNYRRFIYPGRAGTVTRVSYITKVDPVSGTNVIKVEKASFGGTTMLSAASVSLNGATADTGAQATLTATGADLAITAAQGIAVSYEAGTQGTDAEAVAVAIEFEPTDF